MPITISGGVITETPAGNQWHAPVTGVFNETDFAVADQKNPLKQVKFSVVPTTNTQGTATISVNVGADSTIDLSAVSGAQVKVAKITDVKTYSTDGGTFTQDVWQTRVLNTVSDPGSIGVTVTANQFTLPAGTYFIYGSAPAYTVNRHRVRLYDITGAATVALGTSEHVTGAGPQTRSFVIGVVTITASNVYELQHICQTTANTVGFGLGSSYDTPGQVSEVFAQLFIVKFGS